MEGRFYDVLCRDCGSTFEVLTAFADFSKINCPACDSTNLQITLRIEQGTNEDK